MSRHRFGTDDRVVIRGVAMVPVRAGKGGYVFRRLEAPCVEVEVTDEDLDVARDDPQYRYQPGHFAPGSADARLHSGVSNVVDIPGREMPATMRRIGWVEDFLRIEKEQAVTPPEDPGDRVSRTHGKEGGLATAIRLILERRNEPRAPDADADAPTRKPYTGTVEPGKEVPPCTRSLHSWIRTLEKAGLRNREVLRDRHRFSGASPRLALELEAIMARVALGFAAETRITKTALYGSLKAVIAKANETKGPDEPKLPVPCDKSFFKRIGHLDHLFVQAGRRPKGEVVNEFSSITQGLDAKHVGEVVILDNWRVELHVIMAKAGIWETLTPKQKAEVERLRPWCCVAIDAASRAILGMVLSREQTADTVVEVLRMVVSDKVEYSDAAGALSSWSQKVNPEGVLTDGGTDFTSDEVRRVLAGLRIIDHTAPAERPTMKGIVERFFGTVHVQLLTRFTGRTFSNTVEKGDYDAQARASVDIDGLCRILVRYVVDQYHNTPHRGLNGETPARAFARLSAAFGGRPMPDRQTMAGVFGDERPLALGVDGVRILDLRYQSRRLADRFRREGTATVVARFYPHDLGGIVVRFGEAWHWCGCVKPGLDGVSLSQRASRMEALIGRTPDEVAHDEAVVNRAVLEMDAFSREGIARFGLGDVRPRPEDYDRLERELDLGWIMPGDETPAPEFADMFAERIGWTGSAARPSEPPVVTTGDEDQDADDVVVDAPAPARPLTPHRLGASPGRIRMAPGGTSGASPAGQHITVRDD